MKEKLIKMLNENYKDNIEFLKSDSTNYAFYLDSLDKIKDIENKIKDFLNVDMINNFNISYINNLSEYKVMFSISYGWVDGIDRF